MTTIKNQNIEHDIKKERYSILTKKELLFMYIVTIVIVSFINFFYYFYIKLPTTNTFIISIILTYIMPVLIVLYSFIYEYYYIPNFTTDEAIKELNKENLKEKQSSIGVIVFGLALFLIALKRKHIGSIIPFLIFAVIFGLSIPEILDHFIIDHDNFKRMLFIETLEFGFIVLSKGFLFMGFYLTIYYFTKHSEIKFHSLHG